MKSLEEIIQAVPGLVLEGAHGASAMISQVSFDSRQVGAGTLFVALEGARQDGHDFVEAAAGAGATAVLVNRSRLPAEALSCAVVSAVDTRASLGALASAFYGAPSSRQGVIGITGTNGKTTTSYLIEAIFKAAGRAPGVIGTINYRWPGHVLAAPNTTPESLVLHRLMAQMEADGVADVVMEVSSHGLSSHRLGGVLFDVAVFTNLSQDHLDFHLSMQAYRDAKRRLFLELLPAAAQTKRPRAVVNLDDEEGRALATLLAARNDVALLTYSLRSAGADVHCLHIREHIEGTSFTVQTPAGELSVETGLLGEFNVSNCLAAIGAALAMGVELSAIRRGLASLAGVAGRLERVDASSLPAAFVDYAHSPDALERALVTLRPLVTGKLIVVFGCGGDRDRHKRALMGGIAARLADQVVVTSDNPRNEDPEAIIAAIVSGVAAAESNAQLRCEPDRHLAIAQAIAGAADDDVVLIAGKGHENYQEIGGVRYDFDDLDEARRALWGRR
ncbi:MAG: UDP-N-acetylmuramoyl-L-alanyl-D-glutamate--2,6-diaminopimelate ligase [Bradymonadaceae bacterium]|nr:UDP-N-acetylmuramoyl-L-alanyl-D-glutamate--2,6-diaminopimelate ligase [Lujinxingiaceae bacterium]